MEKMTTKEMKTHRHRPFAISAPRFFLGDAVGLSSIRSDLFGLHDSVVISSE
jgi:hypothetical protein